ncbi:MAG: YbjN domain-containing protein [Deltaproteobacteria bacterium]|jgi:hypothetical protein|nr:YbjN domain-containing protein [Deltaproteobacteria bacterium]
MPTTFSKKLLFFLTLTLISITLVSGKSHADDDTIYATINSSQLLQIIKNLGYPATYHGDNIIVWEIDEEIAALKISNEEDNFIFLYFNSSLKASLANVNQWNSEKMFSKAYLDDEGAAFLEIDLDIRGGVTEANIVNFLKICVVTLNVFNKEVGNIESDLTALNN